MNRKLWWDVLRRIPCRLGLHKWQSKPSRNVGETFHRCTRCDEVYWGPSTGQELLKRVLDRRKP